MKKNKSKLEAKSSLENYVYGLKNTIRDDKVAEKLGDKREELGKEIESILQWLDMDEGASQEDYDNKYKELQQVANPIIKNIY